MTRTFAMTLMALITFNPIAGSGATDNELLSMLEQIYEPTVMVESTLTLSVAAITLRDCQLFFDEGEFVPFVPITVDSQTFRYGGFFTGSGRFLFNPPLAMERQQIDRFFNADTLNRVFVKALIFCNDTILRQLRSGATIKNTPAGGQSSKLKDDLLNVLRTYKSRYFFFQALQNLVSGSKAPFLTTALDLKGGSSIVLQCDPLETDEMGLFREEWLPGPGHFLLLRSFQILDRLGQSHPAPDPVIGEA